MIIVGIDPSLTATGVVREQGNDGRIIASIRTKLDHEANRMQRIIEIRDQVKSLVGLDHKRTRADFVVIEGYSFASQGRSVYQLGELGGALRMALYEARIPYVEIPPTTLKMFATGNGSANKDAVLLAAARRLPHVEVSNNNEADAAWLVELAVAAYGVRNVCHRRALDLPQNHLRALAKLPPWPSYGQLDA